MKDYYNLLGVERYCGDRNLIREKYREQIFFFHPDRNNVPYEIALLKTQELNEVWNTLSDDQAKTKYDSLLREYYDALNSFQNFKNSQDLQNSKGFKNSQDLKNPRNFKNSQDFKNSRNFKNSQGFTNSQNYKTAQGSASGRSTAGPTGGSASKSTSQSTRESASQSQEGNRSSFNWNHNGSPFAGINKGHGCQNRDRAIGGSLVAIVIVCLICFENIDVLFSCNHVWTAATCTTPATCTKCGATDGSAAGHTWIDATCTSPKTCSVCNETEGRAIGHKIIGGTFSSSRICEECGIELAALTPPDGYMFEDTSKPKASTLTIHSSAASSYYIKLKDESDTVVMSFYVNPGADVTIKVPGEKLYAYFASGDTWYGTKKLFGESTTYAKDDGPLDFANNIFEYTLDPVSNGNSAQTVISADDF